MRLLGLPVRQLETAQEENRLLNGERLQFFPVYSLSLQKMGELVLPLPAQRPGIFLLLIRWHAPVKFGGIHHKDMGIFLMSQMRTRKSRCSGFLSRLRGRSPLLLKGFQQFRRLRHQISVLRDMLTAYTAQLQPVTGAVIPLGVSTGDLEDPGSLLNSLNPAPEQGISVSVQADSRCPRDKTALVQHARNHRAAAVFHRVRIMYLKFKALRLLFFSK